MPPEYTPSPWLCYLLATCMGLHTICVAWVLYSLETAIDRADDKLRQLRRRCRRDQLDTNSTLDDLVGRVGHVESSLGMDGFDRPLPWSEGSDDHAFN